MKGSSFPIQIMGIAFDAKSSFMRGPRLAPARIYDELLSFAYNPYSERLVDVLCPSASSYAGDIAPDNYGEINSLIKANMKPDHRYLFVGGDHSISYPIVDAAHSVYGDFHLLHFDAHSDLYDELAGDRYSHACPFARIMEDRLTLSLTQVGIRTITPHQKDQADKYSVEVIAMKDLSLFDPLSLRGPIYISLDIDVFDPAFAPGVSHREAAGLDPRTLISWLQAIDQPIVGADIVEYNPLRDISGITASLCYKLVKEMLDLMIRNPLD